MLKHEETSLQSEVPCTLYEPLDPNSESDFIISLVASCLAAMEQYQDFVASIIEQVLELKIQTIIQFASPIPPFAKGKRMAASAGHVRSSSLPTSSTHPLVLSVEEQLTRLKASQHDASPSISDRLGGLKELYDRVDDMIHSRFPKAHCIEHLEDVLCGSLTVLDVCGTVRDVLSWMRESLQALESSLRRKTGLHLCLESEIRAFMVTKKEMNKAIRRRFRGIDRKCKSTVLDNDTEMLAVVTMLREAEDMSLSVFDSLLSFLLLPKLRSKPSGMSIVSKLLQSKRASCDRVESSEARKVEAELIILKTTKDIKVEQVQKVLKDLEAFQATIKEAEEGLECMFRKMLKTRVSLLNILNH
ncbi:hypothetical protein V6N13_082860 [Hibiscus sabdariffa]|uniref:DUF241 domain protein n=1 Tax=Hibiscus sabdariffa TaxID=183260 RepID=A0ABR2BZX8_9ROSI